MRPGTPSTSPAASRSPATAPTSTTRTPTTRSTTRPTRCSAAPTSSPRSSRRAVRRGLARGASGSTRPPGSTDLTNEGTEDIDGDEVVHVTGTADVPKILADLTSVAEQTGQTLSPTDQRASSSSSRLVTEAHHRRLRQRRGQHAATARPRHGDRRPDQRATRSAHLSIGIADANSEQEIAAPEDPQPLARPARADSRRRRSAGRARRRWQVPARPVEPSLRARAAPGRTRRASTTTASRRRRASDELAECSIAARIGCAARERGGTLHPFLPVQRRRLAVPAGPLHPARGDPRVRARRADADLLHRRRRRSSRPPR